MSGSYWEEEANSLEIQCTELQEKIEQLEHEKTELVECLKDVYMFLQDDNFAEIDTVYLSQIFCKYVEHSK
mgnify:CR=1 FL=1